MIKYRYYLLEYKELLPVLCIDFVNDCFYVLPFAELEGGSQIEVRGLEKLEQYTGQVHEKREVFEGDVFQHPDGTKFFVKWDQGHCSFRANYYDDNLTSLLISQFDKNRGGAKYIGNIHEVKSSKLDVIMIA